MYIYMHNFMELQLWNSLTKETHHIRHCRFLQAGKDGALSAGLLLLQSDTAALGWGWFLNNNVIAFILYIYFMLFCIAVLLL